MYLLSNTYEFPDVDLADDDGLLAIGGDLNMNRLLVAYRQGIFPFYNAEEPICWWCPDPRFVLFPNEFKVSKSMKKVLQHNAFTFTINKAFDAVIENCKGITRKGQDGTWISVEMKNAYSTLHKAGFAHSAEAWCNGELAGGLYGIRLGNVFFGESMFSNKSNASKFAFIKYIQHLKSDNIQLIDCQVYTPHLESLGAKMISRKSFSALLSDNIE